MPQGTLEQREEGFQGQLGVTWNRGEGGALDRLVGGNRQLSHVCRLAVKPDMASALSHNDPPAALKGRDHGRVVERRDFTQTTSSAISKPSFPTRS
ncbi:MAG: hypothetical protein JWO56_3593 [Acidobacteria bacterium]|nr:hypothetical protein [Acidobacteriota bacterium]